MLVTPSSELIFKILDRSSFLKDSLIGERTIHLSQILEHYQGRCENLELNMDLLGTSKADGRSKAGELVVVLNGLKIENFASQSNKTNGVYNNSNNGNSGAINTTVNCGNADATTNGASGSSASNGRSSILSGGIRARMRLRSTLSNSSTNSTNSNNNSNNNNNSSVNNNSASDTAFFGPSTVGNPKTPILDSANRRHNDYNSDQTQHGVNRTGPNVLPNTSCNAAVNRNSDMNWDQQQCNGVSPTQRPFMVGIS